MIEGRESGYVWRKRGKREGVSEGEGGGLTEEMDSD